MGPNNKLKRHAKVQKQIVYVQVSIPCSRVGDASVGWPAAAVCRRTGRGDGFVVDSDGGDGGAPVAAGGTDPASWCAIAVESGVAVARRAGGAVGGTPASAGAAVAPDVRTGSGTRQPSAVPGTGPGTIHRTAIGRLTHTAASAVVAVEWPESSTALAAAAALGPVGKTVAHVNYQW